MTGSDSVREAKKPPIYSRAELMDQLGLLPDEIDRLLASSKGEEAMRATLSAILDHLRSIYDLANERISSFLKRHHDVFSGPPLALMLRDGDGADRVERYLASEVYSTW